MMIRNKGIIKDRYDAPFIGTLISAISCKFGCKDCINEYMKTDDYSTIDANVFIKSVVDDPMQEGIILAGLEWSLQSGEMLNLIDLALKNNLKVILYTGLPDKIALLNKVPGLCLFEGRGVYVKYGQYDDTKLIANYVSHGVLLASSNQYIDLL